jgi:hypothetical protein
MGSGKANKVYEGSRIDYIFVEGKVIAEMIKAPKKYFQSIAL